MRRGEAMKGRSSNSSSSRLAAKKNEKKKEASYFRGEEKRGIATLVFRS